jgi:hypothetical protein
LDTETEGSDSDEQAEELVKTREELASSRQHAEDLLEAAERRYDALLGEKEKLEGSIHTFQQEAEEATSTRDDALARIAFWETYKADLVEEREKARAPLQKELDLVKSESAKLQAELSAYQAQIAAYKDELSSLRQSKDSLAQELAAKELELQKEKQATTTNLAELEKKHGGILREATTSFEGQLAKQQVQSEENARQLEEKHGKVLAELHDTHWKAIQATLGQQQGQTRDQNALHSKELERLVGEHTQERERLSTNHQNEIRRVRDEAETKLQTALSAATESAARELTHALREQHVRDLQDADASIARAAAEAEATAAARHASLQSEHQEALASLTAQIQQKDSVLADKDRRFADRQKEFLDELDTQRSSHQTALAKAKAELENKIEELKTDRDSALAKAKEEQERSIADLTTTHEQVKAEQDRSIIELKSVHDASLASLKDAHERSVVELKSTHESDFATHKSAHEQSLNELRAQLDEQSRLANERHRTLEDSHKDALSQAEARHEENLASLRAQHQTQLETESKYALEKLSILAATHDSNAVETQAKHEATFADQQAKYEFKITALESDLQEAKQVAETLKASTADTTELEEEHQRQLEEVEQHWMSEINDLRNQHLQELQVFAKQTDEDEIAHKAMVAELEALRAELEDAEARGREQQIQLEKHTDTERSDSTVSIHAQEIESLKQQLREHQEKHEAALKKAEEDKQQELKKMEAMIAQSLAEELLSVSKVHQKQTKKMLETHESDLADRENAWNLKLDNAKNEHEQQLANSRQLTDSTVSNQIAELKRLHEEELAAAEKNTREQLAAAAQEHKSQLDAALARTRQMSEADAKKLKRRHQDAVAEVRLIMQNQSKMALAELEEKHKKVLEAANKGLEQRVKQSRAVSSETHQAEIMRLESETQVKLGELERRLQAQKSRELDEKQLVYSAELTALQARLDATLTGQAEAERALAVVRKQGAEGEKRILEVKSSMEEQLKTLREEKSELASQLRHSRASLKDFESKLVDDDVEIPETNVKTPIKASPSPATPSRRTSMHAAEFNIARLEQELAAAQILAQRRLEEKSEMVRQNDFLIKELEVLLAQRSHGKATTSAGRSDALVQTEPLISEPKVDQFAMRQIKAEMQSSQRPPTPLTPEKKQAREEIDRAWHGRSFEGYLRQAQIELSELDDVINANEVLFAQKLQEHAGDLQTARDRLALEFQEKFDKLTSEKIRMEKMVTVKQQAAFAEERQRLIDIHSLDFGDNSVLPQSSSAALQTAEQRAVADFAKRLEHRKLEIALKHAEQFQALTREYDQRLAALLQGKEAAPSDLVEDAMKFEFGLTALDTKPQRAGGNKRNSMSSVISSQRSYIFHDNQSVSSQQQPERSGRSSERRTDSATWTSAPRTTRSLPRHSSSSNPARRSMVAPPLPSPASTPRPKTGNGAGNPNGTLPFRQTYADGSAHYAPITTHSLIRGKTAADVLPAFPPKTPTESIGPMPTTPRTPTGASAPLIMKASGAGPVIPMRRSIPPSVTTPVVPDLPQQAQRISQQQQPQATPDFAQQQASTIARARESMSLERYSTRTTVNNHTAQSPPPPPPYAVNAQQQPNTKSPTALPPLTTTTPSKSTTNATRSPSASISTTTPGSTRRTSGLFHLKRSVKQALTSSSPTKDSPSSASQPQQRADETPSPSTSMLSGKASSLRHSIHSTSHRASVSGRSPSVDRKRLSSGMIYWRPPKTASREIFDAGLA